MTSYEQCNIDFCYFQEMAYKILNSLLVAWIERVGSAAKCLRLPIL